MGDDLLITCADIKKRLKPFLEDLLAEDEYQVFVSHIKDCAKCRNYVGAIGSVSNQLWELGNVRVPSDFSSTVLFNLDHMERIPSAPKRGRPKKLIVVAAVLVISIAAFLIGVNHFKGRRGPGSDDAVIIKKETIRSGGDSEGKALLDELQNIATGLGVNVKKDTEGTKAEKTLLEEELSKDEGPAPADPGPQAAVSVKPAPLHWHFIVSKQGGETTVDYGEKDKKEAEVRKKADELRTLEGDIKVLQEKSRVELGKSYTEKTKTEIEEARNAANLELQQRIKERSALEGSIRSLEEEVSSIELSARQASEEKRRRDSEREQRLSDALNTADITPNYRANDHILLTGTGPAIETAASRIQSFSGASYFTDFTKDTSIPSKGQLPVSVYIEREASDVLHWHVGPVTPGQRSEISDMIHGKSGSVDHESEDIIIFSISTAELETLRGHITALGVPFSEFGRPASKGKLLSSKPVTVSVYFPSK
ncbi:MAG: hypothetical protein WC515_05185 [Candidatus Omnitrophota bacterium]